MNRHAITMCLAGAVLMLSGISAAQAGTIETLTFAGTVTTGYDSSNMFGGGSLTGDSYTATITFNPLAIGSDSCGSSTQTTSCNWSAAGSSSFTEQLTIAAGAQSYSYSLNAATTSSLSLVSGGNDAAYLYFGGNNYSISLNVVALANSKLFANDSDVNNLTLNLNSVALNPSSSDEYGSVGGTSFTLGLYSLSATPLSTTVANGPVIPEPGSLAVFGTVLAGLGFAISRRRAA